MDIYFIRLCKMVLETCRSVLWELLLQLVQLVQPPYRVIDLVEDSSKNTKTPVLKDLLEFWKENNTTTPIETDFDISSLCIILRFVLQRKLKYNLNRETIIKAIDFLKEKRNNLAHHTSLSMSFEEYNNDYLAIRDKVDMLESIVNTNYKSCNWIKRSSSKYLNKIDRINKYEHIDPDGYNELQSLIQKWKNEISEIENQSKSVEQADGRMLVSGAGCDKIAKCDIGDSSEMDPYDQGIVGDTLNKMEDVIGLVDENEEDMNEITKKEREKQQAKIETLEETIVKIQKKEKRNSNQTGIVEEAVYGVDKKDNSHERDHLIRAQKREIEEAIESADLHVKKCRKEFDEEIKLQRIKYEEMLSFEKIEKDLKIKQVDENFLLSEDNSLYNDLKMEKEDIEKKFQDVISALEKEYEEKKSNSLKTYKEKIDMIMHDKEYIITKIKEKFQNKILSI